MKVVLTRAIEELKRTEANLKEVEDDYYEVAVLEYLAARARIDAIIREVKKGGNINVN